MNYPSVDKHILGSMKRLFLKPNLAILNDESRRPCRTAAPPAPSMSSCTRIGRSRGPGPRRSTGLRTTPWSGWIR